MKFSIFSRLMVLALLCPVSVSAENFKTNFSKSFRYIVPYRHNTTAKAISRADGVLAITIDPGMHGASSDKGNGKERAELGRKLRDSDVWVRQSFRIRTPKGFRAGGRTMVSQIKFSDAPSGLGSPPIAVYASQGGAVKCNDYASGKPSQNDQRTAPKGVRLDDGKWHSVVMDYIRSDQNGYCRVMIDGRVMIEMRGIDSDQNGDELVARIGPYRDVLPYSQTIYFDDWTVRSSKQVPAGLL